MGSDSASLLDLLVGESSLRVASYARALELAKKVYPQLDTEAAAELFVDFVSGERWKLDVLSMVIGAAHRRSTAATVLESAEKISRWVEREEPEALAAVPEVIAEPDPRRPELPDPTTTTRKKTRRKTTT